ncbi:PPE domain-containing protein [Nocardia sp. NPDC052566]|uniref:PPE domain-containing protein n=1 Tax=Nocardia sp. NPDC052566 TaxID=3364330 RepID=UPI0037C704E5
MVEPHESGFTGRVWEAVPAEKLARDLESGPGSAPTAQAGAAYAHLAIGLGEAAVEVGVIRAALDIAWQSDHRSSERLAALGTWFADAAATALANAAKAEAQALAHEVARLAMPGSSEIAILEAVKSALLQGLALGSPIKAVAADIDDKADIATAHAARVMREYERATAPLAQPWSQADPPRTLTESAQVTEQAAAQPPTNPAASVPVVSSLAPAQFVGGLPRVKSGYRAPTFVNIVDSAHVAETVVPAPVTVGPAATPIAPVAPVTGQAQDQEHHPQIAAAAQTPGDTDRIGLDLGYTTAPAVVGGLSAPRAQRPDVPEAT